MSMLAFAAAAPARAQGKALKVPPREEKVLSNGLKVIAARRGPLPLVAIRLVIRAGTATDPKDKQGLADLVSEVMRRGTKSLSADQLNEAVEQVGGSLGLGVSEDLFSVSISAPSEHFATLMDVLGQLVREPSFPAAEVESARKRGLAQLQNALDDPEILAERAFLRAYWGDHPYGREPMGTASSLKKITRDDLIAFHRDQLGPKISTLLVVGEVEPSAIFSAAEKVLGGWKGGPAAPVVIPPLETPVMAGQVLLVDKPEQTQTQMRIASPGIRKGHPDYFAITAFNTVLGSSFTSRLMSEIRVKRGLSYGASSHFDTMQATGTFGITSFTATETTRQLIDVALEQVEKMRAKGPTPSELKTAQSYVSGLYPARLETNESIAAALAEIELYGLGADWIDRWRERMGAISAKQANEAAAKYLPASKPVLVLVGNAAAVKDQLKGLGPVTVKKVSDFE
jgi:zinc protease